MMNLPNTYGAIDIETTGLEPKSDKIIEIAGVLVENGKVTAEKSTLVNPRQQLSEHVRELTGIQDDMLRNAPGIETVIKEYVEFLQGFPLLGHNIMFDYRFLKRAAVNQGLVFEKEGIDTLVLSRKYMPEGLRKNLASTCEYFHVETGTAHRALGDAYAAHGLYQALMQCCKSGEEHAFIPKQLVYKIKKEQLASKRQKELLHELLKYHKIEITAQIDYLSRNEVSRITDKIISQYGRIM